MTRIGVVACESMRAELEQVIKDEPDVVAKRYIKFGSHVYPEKLKHEVAEAIEEVKSSCDIVVVGFGFCQSLQNLSQLVSPPILMAKNEDCISILLTGDKYHQELKKEAGTYFMTPGWCEQGLEGIKRDLHVDDVAKQAGIDSDRLLHLLFRNYTRVLYVDTGTENARECEKVAEDVARMLKVKFETTTGSLNTLKDLFSKAKNFKTLPPCSTE